MHRSPRRHLTPDGHCVALTRRRRRRVPTLVLAVATVVMAATPASATGANTSGVATPVKHDDKGRGRSPRAQGGK
ncbi:hypothetical protein, partial [Streptomyces vinaceus]|uniref:hypothetical protein n=1 Tax=Streptomyces vinaceus TaxID=1960 RepID=UPI003683A421